MKECFHYRGFGLLIDSELELPDLPVGSSGDREADVVIRLGTVLRVPRKATLDEELAINIIGVAFLIRRGCEITIDLRSDADLAAVRVILLGRVMAFLLRQRGWLPLHASGVVIKRVGDGDECVLFLGAAGAGKSTTAAAFHRSGHLVVTDDVGGVRLTGDGRCVVQTAWPYVRLREDAGQVLGDRTPKARFFQADKYRYDLSGPPLQDQYPVRCAYVLEYGETTRAEPLPTLEAITLLSGHSFVRHRNMERESLERHLRDCASVVGVISVRRLVRPRSIGALPEVVRRVEEDLARAAVPGARAGQ
jgi:hypothetical protein